VFICGGFVNFSSYISGMKNNDDIQLQIDDHTCFGYCEQCGEVHSLGEGNAREHCIELMRELEEHRRIDLLSDEPDARFSTDYLFGDARGQMFGVLECEDPNGDQVILRAFSCQYNGVWELDGWVSPLLDVQKYNEIVPGVDKQIKALGREIDALDKQSSKRKELVAERKSMSRAQMIRIHELYEVNSLNGESRTIFDAFRDGIGIPTGAGDCCAPKLLNHAFKNNLKPIGLAEFYWGKENRSGSKQHGEFYSCCKEKCQPILGFMLCGEINE